MKFMSFLRFFGKRWLRGKPNRKRHVVRAARAQLILEALERRELLAMDVPRIVSVIPVDHSTLANQITNQPPVMQVTFSEAMQGNNAMATGAADPANYLLLDSSGTRIPINAASLNAMSTVATLTYNGDTALPAATYTLFVHGDRLLDVDDSFPLAPPGQLFSANNGQTNVSVVSIPSDGTFGAPENYPQPLGNNFFGNNTPTPWAVAHADFNGDGIPDLVVANGTTNQVAIFAGRNASRGGAFDLTPSLTLNLPAGNTFNQPIKSIVVGDFNGDGLPDIAVANADSNTVSVFLNTRTSVGSLGFSTPANVPAGPTAPIGITSGDFNSDGSPDLAVVNFQPSGADKTQYFVTLLMNDGSGTFGTTAAGPTIVYEVGTAGDTTAKPVVPPSGLFNPASIAAADFNNDGFGDLVVGGSNGLTVLLNMGSGGSNVRFNHGYLTNQTPPVVTAIGPVTALTTGTIAAGGSGPDIAALVSTGTPSVTVLANNGTGTAFAITQIPDPNVTATSQILLADINGDTQNDILFTSGASAFNSQVYTLQNTSSGGTVSFAPFAGSPYPTDSGPIGLDLLDTNGDGIPDLVTANSQGGDVTVLLGNADGTFRVPTVIPLTPKPPIAVVTGDFNGDGIADAAIVNSVSSGTTRVSVLLGLAAGGFTAPFDFSTSQAFTGAVSITVGDVTGDGKPDIILAAQTPSQGGQVEVLTNNLPAFSTTLASGSFTFGAPITVGDLPTQVVVGDFNGDGKLDLAVSHDRGGLPLSRRGVTVLLGNGNGTFQTPFEALAAQGVAASALAVGDFNNDGKADLVVADNAAPGKIRLVLGDGTGGFTSLGDFDTGLINPSSLAVADINGDGFPDVVVGTQDNGVTTGGIAVLINQLGTGFENPIRDNFLPGTALQSIAIADVNQDGRPDVIVATNPGGPTVNPPHPVTQDNVFTLIGNGDGTFKDSVPYLVGNQGSTTPTPSYLAVSPTPLLRVTTFTIQGALVRGNVVRNGNFESRDLSGEPGNLLGWQTFKQDDPGAGGSHGQWNAQTGSTSPISGVSVPGPNNNYQAMLDEADLIPIPPASPNQFGPPSNPNAPGTYSGSNVLYQDIFIPNTVTPAGLDISLQLYLNTDITSQFAIPNPNSLDYRTLGANQQVRVDLVDPKNPNNLLAIDSSGGVLINLFQTHAGDPLTQTVHVHLSTAPGQFFSPELANLLASIKGTTVRIRIAAVNNQGKLIVGVDDVNVTVAYSDTTAPTGLPANGTLAGTPPRVRNPSFFANGIVSGGVVYNNVPFTTDPTIIGQVNDDGSINNVAFVAFDPYGTNFAGTKVYKIITADALGNFTFTIPNLQPGFYNVAVRVVDRSGNIRDFHVPLALQAQTSNEWMATGPNGVDVTGQGVGFTSVSGRITATATDPADLSGNTYYVGSANGGVWKTTDGGSSWLPLTDFVKDNAGNRVSEPIGAMAVAPTNHLVVYAATGVADLLPDSRAGIGVFRSTDGGKTWVVDGDSGTVFAGARISKIVVDNKLPDTAYVAVASGGASGPGVYKRFVNPTNGAVTWVNVLIPTQMTLENGAVLPAGTPLPSVTDLIMDPFDNTHLLIGLGNIGLVANNANAGVWTSASSGGTWQRRTGDDNPILRAHGNDFLPSGANVGRITLGIGNGRFGDEATVFVLISNPPTRPQAPGVDDGNYFGGVAGLYKSKNNLNDITKVLLEQGFTFLDTNTPPRLHHDFQPINFGVEGADYAALAVDPTDPNVVYVGGSRDFTNDSFYVHSLIRVDTGNMQDTSGNAAFGSEINNGDDATKAAQAAANDGFKTPPGFYDPKPGPEVDPYAATNPEGVYWYDIEAGVSGQPFYTGSLFQLPPEITNLNFDAQGRLLIGTAGGLWRGEDHGFGYDFTSGGIGVVQGGNVFNTPGMSLTAINGNLQITSLSSVAINPIIPGTYYTTQYATGSGTSGSPLSWVSQGLTGPNILGSGSALVPNAVTVLTSPTDPNLLYRIWQYANSSPFVPTLRPERSTDGGQTWSAPLNDGIPQSINGVPIKSSPFPTLAINPTRIFDPVQGQNVDELLLGTQVVFRSRTGGNVWNLLTPNPITTGTITAFGIAKSIDGYYYVGTTLGEVFVTTDSFTTRALRSTGLPAARIDNIAVDPNDPAIAYVAIGGGGAVSSHVFKTTNAGMTWVDISAGLPHVSANAIVIDRRPALGTRTGKLYVATDVGVYVTIDEGKTWARVGNSVPNAPVVDLKQNPGLDVLAAAAQGRGVFTISTAQISPIADQIIDTDVNTPGHMSTTGPLAFTINTVGVTQSGYSVQAFSSDQTVVPNANVVIGGSGTTRTVTVTPAAGANTFATGPVTITIVVSDQLGQSFKKTFLVTVLGNLTIRENIPGAVNKPGTFVIGVDTSSTVTANSSDQAIIPSTGIVISNPTSEMRRVTITPAPNQVGTLFITLIVTDTNNNQKATTFAVDVATPVVTLPFTDTFTRPDNPFMGTSWTELTGSILEQSNAAHVASPAATAIVDGVTRADVTLQVDATLPTVGSQVGLVARQSGAGDINEYYARLIRTGTSTFHAQIFRFTNGIASPALADTDVSAFAGVGVTTTIKFVVIGVSLKLYVGTGANNLAAFATDSTIARGAIGVRGSVGTTIDNYSATDVPVAAPTLPDDFSTPGNSNQLDANWEDRSGNFTDNGGVNGVAKGSPLAAGTSADVSVLRDADYANVVVSADVNVLSGQRAGLVARYQGSGDNGMYLGEIDNRNGTPVARIMRSTGPNTWLVLNTSATAPGINGTLRFVVNGDSLQLFLDTPSAKTLLTFATDATLTQGTVGIRGIAGTTFDNFNATAAPTAQASLPFVDAFAATTDGQLQAVWQIRQGDFQIPAGGGKAVGQDPQATEASLNNPRKINLAVLSGLNATTDVTVSATVDVTALGTQAGLVVRYVNDNNFYLGMLVNANGTTMAQIYVNSGGVFSLLSQAVATGNAGTLQFQAVGGTLQLSLGGTPQISINNDLLRTGSVGIRGTATSFINFNATAATSVLPFTDNFAVSGSLSSSWTTVYGNFAVSGPPNDTAAGTAPKNEAVLEGVNSPDVIVSANVNLQTGQALGLVARYSGPGDTNYYLGFLNNVSGTPVALIYFVDSAGTYHPLPLVMSAAAGKVGTLRFEVVGSSLRLFLNNTLLASARDTSLRQGAVGMRGSSMATFANFNASAAPAVLPFSDSFSTPGPLSNSWLNEVGNYTVSAGGTANGTAALNVASLPGVTATDVVLSADVNVAAGQQAGLIARHSALGNSSYYLGRINNTTGTPFAQIVRNDGVTGVIIANVDATGLTAGTLRFEVVGNSLRLYLNNSLKAFATDTTLSTGSVGMLATKTSLDNFNASLDVPTTATPRPFSDNFSAGNAQGQLANTWATRSGDFTVSGGFANGQTPGVNLAVLGGVSIADVNLGVAINLAAGQEAGLVARYNGFGDNSMYVAMIDNTTGTPVANIIRISAAGTRTVIGSAAAQSAIGTLNFKIVGSSLQLLMNGALLVDVTDFNPLAAGTVGIRGSKTTFANFTESP